MKPIFAFILMGAQYDPEKDQAHFETESKHTYIYTVQNIALTEGKVAIGYVTHFAEQDALFTAFFGK